MSVPSVIASSASSAKGAPFTCTGTSCRMPTADRSNTARRDVMRTCYASAYMVGDMRIAIIGAGVSGLTCGVVLTEGKHEVTIFAKEIENTTSHAAAAIWFPYHIA